jgi:hypothetical protein
MLDQLVYGLMAHGFGAAAIKADINTTIGQAVGHLGLWHEFSPAGDRKTCIPEFNGDNYALFRYVSDKIS